MISRVLAAAVVAVLLSSCATGTGTTGTETTGTETAEPTQSPTVTTASQAFDSDCSAIYSTGDLTRILGTGVADPTTYDSTYALWTPVFVLGGTMCLWQGADDNAYLEIAVLPGDASSDDPYCYGEDGDARCSFETTASGLTLSAVVYGATGMAAADLDAGIVELKSLFADAAAAAEPLTPFERPADAWPATLDCADIGDAVTLDELLDAPGLHAEVGNGGAEMPPGVYTAETELGLAACSWEPADYDTPAGGVGMLDVSFLPASATPAIRAAVEALDGAMPLEQAGTDGVVHVVRTDNGVDLDYYWVFSASNALVIGGTATEEQILTAATALVDAANAS